MLACSKGICVITAPCCHRAQLEAYLKELLNHVDPEFSPIIDDFLEFSEHILLGSLLNLEVWRHYSSSFPPRAPL